MTGRVQDTGLEAAPAQGIAFAQKLIDLGGIGSAQSNPRGLNVQMAVELHIVAVHEHGRAGDLLHFAQAADVIDMRVGADDGFHGQTMLGQHG